MIIEYQEGLSPNYFIEAAEIYEAAFGQKISGAIPNRADRVALMRDIFVNDFAFAAVDERHLVGLAGYQTADGSLTSGLSGKALLNRLAGWALYPRV